MNVTVDMIWMKDWLMDTNVVLDKKNVTCARSGSKGKINHIDCFL